MDIGIGDHCPSCHCRFGSESTRWINTGQAPRTSSRGDNRIFWGPAVVGGLVLAVLLTACIDLGLPWWCYPGSLWVSLGFAFGTFNVVYGVLQLWGAEDADDSLVSRGLVGAMMLAWGAGTFFFASFFIIRNRSPDSWQELWRAIGHGLEHESGVYGAPLAGLVMSLFGVPAALVTVPLCWIIDHARGRVGRRPGRSRRKHAIPRPVRIAGLIVLALLPPALIGTLVWHGRKAPPVERAPAANRSADHEADQALRALFEPAPAGTTIKEKVAFYDEKGLFDYIDGAAPLFIERHYRRLAAAELATPEGSNLACAIYDMAVPANAQSIFDKEKPPWAKPLDGWPEAITDPKSLVFHHARYYVKLTAFGPQARAQLPAVARALRERMQ
jgi:hypothetical protein